MPSEPHQGLTGNISPSGERPQAVASHLVQQHIIIFPSFLQQRYQLYADLLTINYSADGMSAAIPGLESEIFTHKVEFPKLNLAYITVGH